MVMRTVLVAALLLATPAAAQPVTQPKACQVTIARAPDDVRAVVETWVKTETQCSVALEIRIVPTEGGLYLLAQDERGRMRERIVPDAQTAGVLVASWIADDNAPPIIVPPPAPPVSAAPVTAIETNESLTPPGLAPISLTATAPLAKRRSSKWITLGSLLPMNEGSGLGLRLEADLLRRGRWLFGAAVSAGESNSTLMSASSSDGYLHVQDYKATATVARPSAFGRWELRPALGLGIMRTTGFADDGASWYSLAGTFATLEGSFMVSRELGKSWALYTGSLATVINQSYQVTDGSLYPRSLTRGNLDLVLLGGLRHRL